MDAPTEPGYYWVQLNVITSLEQEWLIVEVAREKYGGMLYAMETGVDVQLPLEYYKNWEGPLESPHSPGDKQCWITEDAINALKEQVEDDVCERITGMDYKSYQESIKDDTK